MTFISWRRVRAITKKEFFHILRDPFTLGAALGLPIFMVMMFGFAIEFNVKNIHLTVSDSDRTQSSRRLVDVFGSSHYFIPKIGSSPSDAISDILSEQARATLIIPPHFEKDLYAGRVGDVQVLVDGSDSSTVGPISGYLTTIQSLAAKNIANSDPKSPYDLRTRFMFNPELNSRWFVIPGLVVLVMAILSILLTSLTIAREYENGSMELLLTTPVAPLEIIIGKLMPYFLLGCLSVIFIFLAAQFIFGVPFVGNILTFTLASFLFLIAYLAQGLVISVTTRKQMVAMQIAMMSGMLPTQLLSGFVFPIESMPKAFQILTMIFPARWFMEISRDSFLKGTAFIDLLGPFLGLTIFCGLMITIGTRRFKRDLEP
jgi:ABC-2 type transport system permease protein